MFRTLGRLLVDPTLSTGAAPSPAVLRVHPVQLSRWLDEAWTHTAAAPTFGLGPAPGAFPNDPTIVADLSIPAHVLPAIMPLAASGITTPLPASGQRSEWNGIPYPTPGVGLVWHHLIYAYLIESTGAYEIFAEVLRRYAVGELLDTLSSDGRRWVRSTEEIFFRDPPLFSISGVVSQVRPDLRESRRNAYWRMFGMDLPHAVPTRWRRSEADQVWKRDTGSGVNSDFREKWAEFLRQVWLGIENRINTSGTNATDPEYIGFLALALKDMLNMRRRGGSLLREEFVHVSTMDWFHLTLESDTAIVRDLQAEAVAPADRLAKIAQRVGMTPAPRSRELFELADLMSAMLRAIELGMFSTGASAQNLYLPSPLPPAIPSPQSSRLLSDMNRIVDLWQSATGQRVKDRSVLTTVAQPVRLPTPGTAVPASPPPSSTATVLAPVVPGARADSYAGLNGR